MAQAPQAGGQKGGHALDAAGDLAQAFRAVIDGVHRGQDGQQHLGGADVAGGLFAADVLLARLERQAQGGPALGVFGHPHQPAGHVALEGVARGKERGMRAAAAQRHAEALGAAHHDVRAELARRREQRQA